VLVLKISETPEPAPSTCIATECDESAIDELLVDRPDGAFFAPIPRRQHDEPDHQSCGHRPLPYDEAIDFTRSVCCNLPRSHVERMSGGNGGRIFGWRRPQPRAYPTRIVHLQLKSNGYLINADHVS